MSEIFIDNDCSVCSAYGSFIKKRNSDLNVSSQLDLKKSDIDRDEVVYLKNQKKYYASAAVIESISDLGGLYKVAKIFYLVPSFIRENIYKLISKNRKRFFYK